MMSHERPGLALAGALAALLSCCPAQATIITGGVTGTGMTVQDYTATSFKSTTNPAEFRADYKSFDGQYDTTTTAYMWLTNQPPTVANPVSIVYNFNARWSLNSVSIWNYNEPGTQSSGMPYSDRGLKDVVIGVSDDWGQTWTDLVTTTLTPAPGATPYTTPDVFSIPYTEATSLRITATSRFANNPADNYSGLTEVQIDGTKLADATRLPISSATASTSWGPRTPDKTFDSYRYDNDTNHMWLSDGQTTPTITWDLGSAQTFNCMELYNYNEGGVGSAYLNRGVRNFLLQFSMDNAIWGAALGPYTLPKGKGTDNIGYLLLLGEETGITARYTRLLVQSNYGDSLYAGLEEVEFWSLPTSALLPIPEPATLALLGAGLLALARRRRT